MALSLLSQYRASDAPTAKTIQSLTRSGTTATATTSSAHGYATGDEVTVAGATPSGYNGTVTITVTGSTAFTYTVASGLTTPATGTITSQGTVSIVEPVSLTQAKVQCSIDASNTAFDDFLGDIAIPAARDRCELASWRQLITATWALTLRRFPCEDYIELPKPPLQSVTSVTYVDTAGVTQTLVEDEDYTVETFSGPRGSRGRINLAYGTYWPTTRDQAAAVTVTFVAGYGNTGAALPGLLVQGLLLDIGTLMAHREDVETGTIVTPVPLTSSNIYRRFKSRPLQNLEAIA